MQKNAIPDSEMFCLDPGKYLKHSIINTLNCNNSKHLLQHALKLRGKKLARQVEPTLNTKLHVVPYLFR